MVDPKIENKFKICSEELKFARLEYLVAINLFTKAIVWLEAVPDVNLQNSIVEIVLERSFAKLAKS